MGSNQSIEQVIDNNITSFTNQLTSSSNGCDRRSAQAVVINIVEGQDVNVNIGKIKQVADILGQCVQTAVASSTTQSDIDSKVDQAASQVKQLLSLNPGSQRLSNVVRSALSVYNQVANNVANSCNASADQLTQLNILNSSRVTTGVELIEQISKVVGECAQSSTATTSVLNNLKSTIEQKAEQKEDATLLILIVVAVIVLVLAGAFGGWKVAIAAAVVLTAGILVYYYFFRSKPASSDSKESKEAKAEEDAKRDNNRYITNADGAFAACMNSEKAGYMPADGYYWDFVYTDTGTPGPYVPPSPPEMGGKIDPKQRDGGGPGAPAGTQPSVVRQYADILGVQYYDHETDKNICNRSDLGRPSLKTMADIYKDPSKKYEILRTTGSA